MAKVPFREQEILAQIGRSILEDAASVNSDATPVIMRSPRVACNQRIFVRAKSETGQTVSIGFLLGLHTYTA